MGTPTETLVLDQSVLDMDQSLDELRLVDRADSQRENPVIIIAMEADEFASLLMGDYN